MIPKNTISQAVLKELEEFLLSDKTPDECMDISMLHGFLTSLVIGPETVMPGVWISEIWGESDDDEMIWSSMEETEYFIGLIISYFNSITEVFTKNPRSFEPLIYSRKVGAKEIAIIKEWCSGFMQAVDLTYDSWESLIKSDQDKELLIPLALYGTDAGRAKLLEFSEQSTKEHEKWVDLLPPTIISIHNFWLPFRKSEVQSTQQAISNKVGRNDPCPCGSGKKFKKCCMN